MADRLANYILDLPTGYHRFENPPLGVMSMLLEDIGGVCLPRVVKV